MSKLTGKVATHITLGCKVNMYDTQAMLEILESYGVIIVDLSNSEAKQADICIINTCTVTNSGDKKSRQAIRKAAKLNPNAIIVVCGCYAQIDSERIRSIDGVDIILGTNERMKIAEFIEAYLEDAEQKNFVTDINTQNEFEDLNIRNASNKARAYIKIQEGCENFCAYCIIPYARGPIRSRDKNSILAEATRLMESGVKEIVLAGINVGNYGKDRVDDGLNLPALIRELHEVPGIERIRLGSIEPDAVCDQFLEVLKDCSKLCEHLHVSLQSGADKTLAAMNRRSGTKEYREMVARLREIRPNIGITTDIIVGFPGESDDDFMDSYSFVKEMAFSKVHVFPYSSKVGTKAATMRNQISQSVKNERARIMGELAKNLCENFAKKFEHVPLSVLFEQEVGNNVFEGHSSNYIVVRKHSDTDLRNQVLDVVAVHDGEGALNCLKNLTKL